MSIKSAQSGAVHIAVGLSLVVLVAVIFQNFVYTNDDKRDGDYRDGATKLVSSGSSEQTISPILGAEALYGPQQTDVNGDSHQKPSLLETSLNTENKFQSKVLVNEFTQESPVPLSSPSIISNSVDDYASTSTILSPSPSSLDDVVQVTQYIPEQTGTSKQNEDEPRPSETIALPVKHQTKTIGSTCYEDVLQDNKLVCRPKCEVGSKGFGLPGMSECLPLLNCDEINTQFKIGKEIGDGNVKKVFIGWWQNYTLAVMKLKHNDYVDDFQHGLNMLEAFTGSDNVVQLVGACRQTNTYVTEYHPLGNGLNFVQRLERHPELRGYDKVRVRLQLCEDYVRALSFLHTSPAGTRVMCDSCQLNRALHQYLVTNGLRLIVADVDALPEVFRDKLIVCGHKQLTGDLVAPEQRWPYEGKVYNEKEQPGYNEKSDIWKIPNVCEYFLGDSVSAEMVKYHLFDIHKECKNDDFKRRPNAEKVLSVYEDVLAALEAR